MYKEMSLQINGYGGEPVSNRFYSQEEDTVNLSIVLPGLNPPLINPALYYISQTVLANRSDLMQVEHAYYKINKPGENEILERLYTDTMAACEVVLLQRTYRRIMLIGKSLGTRAMAYLLDDDRFRKAECVWLTPLLTQEYVRSQVNLHKPKSLFIVGTADPFYREEILSELVEATGGDSLVIDEMNHGLNITGDVQASIDAVSRIVGKAGEFLF
jgi:hypothetical protein